MVCKEVVIILTCVLRDLVAVVVYMLINVKTGLCFDVFLPT